MTKELRWQDMDYDTLDQILRMKYSQMYRHGGGGIGARGWFKIVHLLTERIYSTVYRSREKRAYALRYNRVLKRALAGDTAGLEWLMKNKTHRIGITDPVAEELLKAEYVPVPDAFAWPQILDIKEKFGGLRYYIDNCPDGLDSAIELAEALSTHTCQDCGAPGHTRETGWLRTLCDGHFAEYVERSNKQYQEVTA